MSFSSSYAVVHPVTSSESHASNVVGLGGFTPGLIALRDNMERRKPTKELDSIISILCPPLGSSLHQKI